MQRKLTGSWNIEFENSYIERDSAYQFLGSIINIQNIGVIGLPLVEDTIGAIDFQGKTFLELDDNFWTEEIMEKGKKHFNKMQQKATGTWRIISTNPDSIFINAPKNPLHGKYAVRFFIDKRGWVSMNMGRLIYKMELTNDSTHLICNKGGVMYTKDVRDWEGKN